MKLAPGTQIAGTYRADRRIGAGGMGEVWAGVRLSDNYGVALKVLHPHSGDANEVVARFRREAQVLARVRSDYVAQVIDFLAEPHGFVLVMDLIPGESLHALLAHDRSLAIEATLDIASDVLCGLRDLHSANIVHRDLKPGNIVLRPRPGLRPRATLIDFGVSRIISDADDEEITAITRGDRVLGTLEYMAPEQILGSRSVTGVADLYAVGALMYRAIAGRHVFGKLRDGHLAVAKLNQTAPPVETDRTDEVAKRTQEFVSRLLSRRLRGRFKNAEAALVEVDAILALVPNRRHAERSSSSDDDETLDSSEPDPDSSEPDSDSSEPGSDLPEPDSDPPVPGSNTPVPGSNTAVPRSEAPVPASSPPVPSSNPPLPSSNPPANLPPSDPKIEVLEVEVDITIGEEVPAEGDTSFPPELGPSTSSRTDSTSDAPTSGPPQTSVRSAPLRVSASLQRVEREAQPWRTLGVASVLFLFGSLGGGLFGFSYSQGGLAFQMIHSAAGSGIVPDAATDPTREASTPPPVVPPSALRSTPVVQVAPTYLADADVKATGQPKTYKADAAPASASSQPTKRPPEPPQTSASPKKPPKPPPKLPPKPPLKPSLKPPLTPPPKSTKPTLPDTSATAEPTKPHGAFIPDKP